MILGLVGLGVAFLSSIPLTEELYMESMLITGASGFVGKYFCEYFKSYYQIDTLGLDNVIRCDLSSQVPELSQYYEVVVHLAGKAHVVPKTKEEADAFYRVNVNGTDNLLKGLEASGKLPKRFVFFSSVAVYGQEKGEALTENIPLLATDPYGESKIMAERLVVAWGIRHGVAVTVLRPPLVVGGDAPGNLGEMVKAIKKGLYFNVAKGRSRRSMVLAQDIPPFLPMVWDRGGIFHLTDGNHPSYRDLSMAISRELGARKVLDLPYFVVYCAACFFDLLAMILKRPMPLSVYKLGKLMNSYTFDDSLARSFGWNGRSVVACANGWVGR